VERELEAPSLETKHIVYNDKIVRQFIAASVFWGITAMAVGFIVALQLAFFQANWGPYFTFGRLRPLHTGAAIFAFVGNMIFAGVYYSTQRLVKARLASDWLGKIHFWGWQSIIVAVAVTLPLGITQSKEYAEFEWPIDIAIAVIWVVFAANFFITLWRRHEKQLYVAIWFYIATIVTVAILHIVNALSIPVTAFKSYSIFGGAQDALVQWWYGHNAVAFVLTTPILGIMYYFVPKAAERPVYSYRLSIIHFWALIFVYIWAGPHHLLNTALPDWAQSLGVVFSLMLWAPSWGGMINGLLTMRGAWDRLRSDPVLKFFAAGLTFYGMATFEGPLLSIKGVSSLAHYTDWIIAHVHAGALGWNGFMAAGMFYWLTPRLYGTKLHSTRLADVHFYIGTVGILLYVISMWVSGITQGMMWRALNDSGGLLYPNFMETLLAVKPLYWTRLAGGTLYLTGMCLMAYNLWRTATAGKPVEASVQVVVEMKPAAPVGAWKLGLGAPVLVSGIVLIVFALVPAADGFNGIAVLLLGFFAAVGGLILVRVSRTPGRPTWHSLLEGRALVFTALTVCAVLIGGVAEIIPALVIRQADTTVAATASPYSALELEGRDLFIREGCYACHSQMIRPFRFETLRYGPPSTLDESMHDHPFQWGSKRTGPDLAREGGKYPNVWHYKHMIDPRSVSEGSNMPGYAFMLTAKLDLSNTASKLRALRSVGVPYTPDHVYRAEADARAEARVIADDLRASGVSVEDDVELVAIIAYLQRLGKKREAASAPTPTQPLSAAHAVQP
jgi:cytochrome c oxidase cbb3-type subunit I/II